ncbi:MAG: hypothetical protein WA715_09190 [Candidatus Acidiferrum sp.]|jgi:hypothetical protein
MVAFKGPQSLFQLALAGIFFSTSISSNVLLSRSVNSYPLSPARRGDSGP